MSDNTRAFLLGPLLKGVSRSFYLTMRILPAGMRDPIGLAYLLARAADTIADTSLVSPTRRLALLMAFRDEILGVPPADGVQEGTGARRDRLLQQLAAEVGTQQIQSDERTLLESLGPALDVLQQLGSPDRQAVREILTTLTSGMEFDLRTFPDENAGEIVALREAEALDRYTYLVAGCVGEFWTTMTYAHLPGTLRELPEVMLARGVRFGKALQMTNVLRDCGKDLRIGRCYLPLELLSPLGLTPQDLLGPDASRRARPVLDALLRKTLDHYREALAYTLAIPRGALRLRLASLWPIFIGLETLVLLARNPAWLDPRQASKIQRNDVYRILAYSLTTVSWDGRIRNWAERLFADIEASLRH
ncbi:squalene/phytoene synthase family protein [Cupriavidus pauculus]|uniref:Squalene/phytoene synthase family protein n=1 Tax=Cupriavidus pauculus TaxID=82633 RepID=A0A5P2HBS3_9BURK|nr:phytoene/squalene synthase family protein [Cupriavidus pauculus]QET05466.1 squalene/phytoene synthase family protein [Cupriavidus pauculus]